MRLNPVVRNEHGWKVETPFVSFYPVSYGIGNLGRLLFQLRPKGRKLMLHYFPKDEDPGEHWHDHPWPFTTLVLWGSYTDEAIYAPSPERRDPTVVRDRLVVGSVRRRPATHRHRVYVHRSTLTLLLTGPTSREWCSGIKDDWSCGGDPADFDATLGRRSS